MSPRETLEKWQRLNDDGIATNDVTAKRELLTALSEAVAEGERLQHERDELARCILGQGFDYLVRTDMWECPECLRRAPSQSEIIHSKTCLWDFAQKVLGETHV